VLVERWETRTYLGQSKRNEQTSDDSRLYILLSRSVVTTSLNFAIVSKFICWFLRSWTHGSCFGTQNVSEARVLRGQKTIPFLLVWNPQTNFLHSPNACCIIRLDNVNKRSNNIPGGDTNFGVSASSTLFHDFEQLRLSTFSISPRS
jgi:hypothetical protein